MLVLARKKHEALLIQTPSGERIRVVVSDIVGGKNGGATKVRLGIEAARDVVVLREEIHRGDTEGSQ